MMKTSKIIFAAPEIHKARRIAEMKSLSYESRIKRLLALIDVSFKIKNASKSSKI
jgi:hypothetical protein